MVYLFTKNPILRLFNEISILLYFNIHLSLNREKCELIDRQQLKLKAKSALL